MSNNDYPVHSAERECKSMFPSDSSNAISGWCRKIALYWNRFVDPDRKIGIWRDSDVYGYEHKPGAVGRHHGYEFDVHYTIGRNGCRETLSNTDSNDRVDVAFLGCSWTFGHGVEDDEHFPAVIARMTGLMCENHGVMGWGTAHALLKLQEIAARNERPGTVIYSLLPDHLVRNAARESWVRGIARYDRRHPHFILSEGLLRNTGLCSEDDIIPDSEDFLKEHETQLTGKMIAEMAHICRENRIEFHVVLLKGDIPFRVCEVIMRTCTASDMSRLRIDAFQSDNHPNPTDHQRIAEALLSLGIPGVAS